MIESAIDSAPYPYSLLSIIGLVDAFLAGTNLFNAFVLFTHLHPVDSPFKKSLVNAKYRIVKKVHSTPFVVSATLSALLSFTTYSAIQYNASASSDQAVLIRAIISAYTFACTSIFVKLSNTMIKLSVDRMLEMEKEVTRHDIVNFKPPCKAVANAMAAPYKLIFPVESIGMDRIPDDTPHLFVSNHSLYGLEMPLFMNELYQRRGIFLRGLAEHFHFATPNGPLLRAFGAVDGTRDNVDALMEARYNILVYPGGGHEIMKHSSFPNYELMWKERLGFARCAIKHGYPIIPCACVGTEDMFDRIGNVPTGYKGMVIPISITTPFRVQKVYFWFGHPISTEQYKGDFANDEFAREVRDKTKAAIQAGIRELQEKQLIDPERYVVNQCASKLCRYFTKNKGAALMQEESGRVELEGGDKVVEANESNDGEKEKLN